MLKTNHWPGNVRELKNVLESALMLSKGWAILPDHFAGLRAATPCNADDSPSKKAAGFTENHILEILKKHGGDVHKAAQAMGISKTTLYRKIKEIKEKGHSTIQSVNKFKNLEELHIISILKECSGDIKKAALSLGVSRPAFYRKIKEIKEKYPLAVDDEIKYIRIDLERLLDKGDMSLNLLLKAGDTLYAPQAGAVYVFGEVKVPGTYELSKKTTSLVEAINLAGGFTERASSGGVKVIRIEGGQEKTIKVNVSKIISKGKMSDDIPLLDGDVIVIPESFF